MSPPIDISALRRDYAAAELDAASMLADPIDQFNRWFAEAVSADVREPNAMTLATVSPDGAPSARIVLLKGVDAGFKFFTSYRGAKAADLDTNPRAALCFFWEPLERQVRIEGTVARVSDAESDEYFASRPRLSQLGAWASHQSATVPGRDALDAQFAEAAARFGDDTIPRPAFWGGYRVTPSRVEFWQGRRSRMHDRIEYRRGPDGWVRTRLAP